MLLPKDPYILLSFLNTRLRDQYADLEDPSKSSASTHFCSSAR